jgi:hypothetical protein
MKKVDVEIGLDPTKILPVKGALPLARVEGELGPDGDRL